DEIGNALGLLDLFDRKGSQLSGGERRRLHTAIALLHRPQLVLLDEPTTGADVRTRNEILELVRNLATDGSAVVYSTHYLHEIEDLGAYVAFIDRGRIVARGAVDDLIHELRLARRDPLPIMVLIVFPIVTMAFLKPAFQPALVQAGHPHANGAEQVVPGQATLSAFFLVSLITFAFFAEFSQATWDRLRA